LSFSRLPIRAESIKGSRVCLDLAKSKTAPPFQFAVQPWKNVDSPSLDLEILDWRGLADFVHVPMYTWTVFGRFLGWLMVAVVVLKGLLENSVGIQAIEKRLPDPLGCTVLALP
jgi:hypothetical protein